MATNMEVAQVLVSAGYLSAADIEAAADVLDDALIIEMAEEAEGQASDDYSIQEDVIAEVDNWAAEDALEGDEESLEDDLEIIAEALDEEDADMAVMAVSEVVIAEAYLDAASALLAAELIDAANRDAVAAAIADVLNVEED